MLVVIQVPTNMARASFFYSFHLSIACHEHNICTFYLPIPLETIDAV
jgi:hypothetical protein